MALTSRSTRRFAAALAAAALSTGLVPAAASTAATAPPYSCAPNGPAGSQTVYGTFGDASVLGWTGNHQAVPACLGGSFFVISGGQPGSGATTPVTGTTYGYGVYNDTTTTWANADGYLPALVTTLPAGTAPACRSRTSATRSPSAATPTSRSTAGSRSATRPGSRSASTRRPRPG